MKAVLVASLSIFVSLSRHGYVEATEEGIDLLVTSSDSTIASTWDPGTRINDCPKHVRFSVTAAAGAAGKGVTFKVPDGKESMGKFSIVDRSVSEDVADLFSKDAGIRMRITTSAPGMFRLRLRDGRENVRFA